MKKIFIMLLVAIMVVSAFVGCSKTIDNEQKVKAAVGTETKETTKAKKEATTSAEEEGNALVVYSAGPKSLSGAIEEAFEAKTGIEVELVQSTTGKILAKLEAEKNNPVADVVVLASWPSAMALKEQGMTQAYAEAANVDKLHNGFVDEDKHIFGYSASALGITYNTNLVNEPGNDWIDYADSKWADMVNIPDPSLSGSCMDFVSGYINNSGEEGWTLFEGLQANGVAIAGANKEALEPVVTGAKGVVLAGVDYMAYSAKAKGEPVDIVYPKSGTVVNPRAVVILKSARNPENAKIYVDYMLSDEAQEFVKDAFIIPGRADIKSDDRANMEDITLLNYDWDQMAEAQISNIEKFNNIFGQ